MKCKSCNVEMAYSEGDESVIPHWKCSHCGFAVADFHNPTFLQRMAETFKYFDAYPDEFQKSLADVVNNVTKRKEQS